MRQLRYFRRAISTSFRAISTDIFWIGVFILVLPILFALRGVEFIFNLFGYWLKEVFNFKSEYLLSMYPYRAECIPYQYLSSYYKDMLEVEHKYEYEKGFSVLNGILTSNKDCDLKYSDRHAELIQQLSLNPHFLVNNWLGDQGAEIDTGLIIEVFLFLNKKNYPYNLI